MVGKLYGYGDMDLSVHFMLESCTSVSGIFTS